MSDTRVAKELTSSPLCPSLKEHKSGRGNEFAIRRVSSLGPRIGAALRLLLLVSGLLPATRAMSATVYAQSEGLPNISIQSLALDEQGYVWAGSEDGAYRFDGHRFLRIEMGAPGELPDVHARRLLAVPGAIYIVTPSRLLRYDLKRHMLRVLRNVDKSIEGLNAIARADDGTLYAGGGAGVLWRWRDDDTTGPEIVVVDSDAPLPAINGIRAERGAVWLATEGGVFRFDPETGRAEAVRFDQPALKNGAIQAVATFEFPADVLWIGYWNDALLRLDLKTKAHRWFHPQKPGAGALRSTSIYSFAARQDRLYVGSNRGIVVYHPTCDCVRGLNHPSWDQVDGAGIVVTSLVPEQDGLWAGIWGGGLVRFGPTDEVFQNQVRRDNRDDSLAHPMVYALHVDEARSLWIGSYGGGVQSSLIVQQRDGEHWLLKALPMAHLPIESRFVWSLSSSDSALTIGTGRGVFRWQNEQLGELKAAALVESVRSGLTTRDGRRYVAGMRGLYREQSGSLIPIPLLDRRSQASLPQSIWSIAEQGEEIWLGTINGLVRLDRGEQVVAWHRAGPHDDQLPGSVVRVQKHDAAGNLWIGTSGGLISVGGSTELPVFERHAALAQVGVNSVVSIEFDRAAQVWLGSPNGLARYHPQSKTVDRYDRQDGLVSDQFNVNASASDGRLLYFGAMGGLTAFDPAQLPDRQMRLSPRISRLRLGQGPWRLDVESLQLEHEHQPIQIELSALSYSRPRRLRYAYRWREIDREFTELGDAQSVVLSRLPSGTHTLEVRASVDAANIPAVIAPVLSVNVASVWYATWWGRIAIGGLLASLLFAWTRWRTLRARSYATKLEGDVAKRTVELTAASAALVVANARLQQQAGLDPLTGLANRRQLFEVAAERLRDGASCGLLLCDLDHFKRINDTFGHQVGDAVLCDFASLLQSFVGPNVMAARYGGEEFVLLLFDVSEPELLALTSRLFEAVRTRRMGITGDGEFAYTTSSGLAVGVAGESLDAIIRRADQALYRAKHEGRNRWVLDDGTTESESSEGHVRQTRSR